MRLFGTRPLTTEEIKQADSLLVQAVNYYNSKQGRFYKAINLSDSLYSKYTVLRLQRSYYNQFFSKKGKLKKGKVRRLYKKQQVETPLKYREIYDDYIVEKEKINYRINELEEISRTTTDSIVLTWGARGHIDIHNYIRQYQYGVGEKGNIGFIRASCYCEKIANEVRKVRFIPQDQLVTVHDGGNCFFKIYLDLKKNKAKIMRVNGIQ